MSETPEEYPVEPYVPYDESAQWELHDAYYAARGIDAFRDGEVPNAVTNNPLIAEKHAEVILSHLRIHEEALSDPIDLVEIGGGAGRFAANLMEAIHAHPDPTLQALGQRIRYVLTDYTRNTLVQAAGTTRVKHLIDTGKLVPAVMNLSQPDGIVTLDGDPVSVNPTIVLGNYITCVTRAKQIRRVDDHWEELWAQLRVRDGDEALPDERTPEALAGIAFTQLTRPGAPVIFGTFSSAISMQSGAPTFGTPEPSMVLFSAAKLARRLGVPFRSGGSLNASKIPDAQASSESSNTLWPSILGGVNFVLHAAGWLEGGLVSDYAKFIIDAEMIQGLLEVLRPIDVSDEELAVEAIGQVKPGGHFFGEEHTKARYEQAFYTPFLSDWRPYEMWHDKGALDATLRAGKIYKSILAEYQTPRMDSGIREELDEFVELREREGGAPVQ